MSYKSVMVIKAAVCLVFGVILISVPGALLSLLGAALSPGGSFTSREYAAALFGNLMLTWFARNAADSDARRAIILALFIYDAIGFIVSLSAVLSGVLNPLGWFIVAVYLFFTLTFGNLLRAKKAVA
jgi:hypothetical protein